MFMKEFKVTIDQFDGPLDLMLHLIKEKKMDLLDLDLNELTDQYIAYLDSMKEMQLEVAGEYLIELVTLLEYKSRRMIPGNQDEIDTEQEDVKERLVKRLLEYQQYKDASVDLAKLYEGRQLLLTKPMSAEVDQWMKEKEDAPVTGSPYDLLKAMQKIYHRMQLQTPQERSYVVSEISIEDRELEVRAKLSRLPQVFRFENLLDDCTDSPQKAIATFLSILDLARLHILAFTVDDNDVIWFTKGGVAS